MLKRKSDSRNIPRSILLLFSILIVVGLVGSADGSVYTTYYASDYNILNGTYLAGSVPASVQTVDSDYFIVRSSPSATSTSTYNPLAYNLLGNTAYVSGTTGDLVSNNSVYMTFRSYAQSLYSHQEMTTIGGTTYYLLKLGSADVAGTTLSADAGTTGRKLMAKFVYQLTGVSSIPASTWTIYYRAYNGHVNVEAHGDVDILVRMSNGTIRSTIATNVANSGALTTSYSTVSGSYSWAAYTVVDQTDYLEIDYYIEVTTIKAGYFVYLRIDDNTLAVTDQTRATNICLLNENTMETEFTGSSNMYNWTQLVWNLDSAWTTDSVTVTLQLYNFTLGAYPTSGNGFISYTSSATANTDETKAQTITTNPRHFRDATGNWKIKVKGVKSTNTQFDFRADWIEFKPTYYSEYMVSTEFLFSSMTMNTPTQLNFTVVSQYNIASVSVTIQVWNYSSSVYANSGQGYLQYISLGANETKLLTINTNPQFYTSNGNAKIKITGVVSTTTQYQQETNQIKLLYAWVNSPPVLGPIGNKTVDELTPLTFTATASDPDVPPQTLTFSLGAGAPAGASINASTGVFTWTPTEAQGPGVYTIRVIVSDSSLTDYEDVSVTVNEVNVAPVLDLIGPKSVNELELLTFTATATDSNIPAQALTFSLGPGAPEGASINATTGVFSWTPTEAQGPGNYTIRVVVSDGSLTDYEDISVSVYEVHIHDVAVINVTASPTNVISGQVVGVTVIVKNQGTAIETFNVAIFYNETIIETKTVNGLAAGDQRTLEFTWNTAGVTEASYRIRAVADSVSGETDTNNNTYTAAIVTVNTQASLPPFDWVTALLYMLPVLFGFLFLLGLGFKRKKKTKPHIEKKTDAFSQQFGMTHQQMVGKKMLLEIDPTTNYQKALSSFVAEAKNNGEPLLILTNKNSTLHSAFSEAANVKFLLLTSKTSSPQQINEKENLLPASDLSVLLDAFVRMQKAEMGKTINLLFDSLSDIIVRCGFEKSYKFTRFLLEAIASPKTTALFLFNPVAHELSISSSIRGLFQNHLAYAKSGPKVGTL